MKQMLPKSLWTETKKESALTIPLDGPTEADITVIGGGITGLTAAIHLRDGGTENCGVSICYSTKSPILWPFPEMGINGAGIATVLEKQFEGPFF